MDRRDANIVNQMFRWFSSFDDSLRGANYYIFWYSLAAAILLIGFMEWFGPVSLLFAAATGIFMALYLLAKIVRRFNIDFNKISLIDGIFIGLALILAIGRIAYHRDKDVSAFIEYGVVVVGALYLIYWISRLISDLTSRGGFLVQFVLSAAVVAFFLWTGHPFVAYAATVFFSVVLYRVNLRKIVELFGTKRTMDRVVFFVTMFVGILFFVKYKAVDKDDNVFVFFLTVFIIPLAVIFILTRYIGLREDIHDEIKKQKAKRAIIDAHKVTQGFAGHKDIRNRLNRRKE